tara:strand:- start:97 stop:543 length:447 start_codon:yes stop_codon:yes gene_type:complete
MNKSLLNLPEYYCFRTNKESTEKVFRYSDHTSIEFYELEFIPRMGIVHSLSLSDREISILIGEKDKKRSKGKTHTGTIMITEKDVFLEIAYDQKQFDQLLSYIDKNGIKNNLQFNASITKREAKKLLNKNLDYCLVEEFSITHNIDKR